MVQATIKAQVRLQTYSIGSNHAYALQLQLPHVGRQSQSNQCILLPQMALQRIGHPLHRMPLLAQIQHLWRR